MSDVITSALRVFSRFKIAFRISNILHLWVIHKVGSQDHFAASLQESEKLANVPSKSTLLNNQARVKILIEGFCCYMLLIFFAKFLASILYFSNFNFFYRFDRVEIEPDSGNRSFNMRLPLEGTTIMSVASYLTSTTTPAAVYYFPINVLPALQPQEQKLTIGLK